MADNHVYRVEIGLRVRLNINDPEVVERTQTSEWRSQMYDFTEDQALEHLAWNLAVNGLRLSQIDGWADCADDAATATLSSRWVEAAVDEGKAT